MSPDAEERYRDSLDRHGARDVQPTCRELLRRLKTADRDAYEAALRRFEEGLLPRLERGEDDPLALWVDYAAWLADRSAPGRTVSIAPDGLAGEVASEPGAGVMILHLPDEVRRAGIVLVSPAEPSEPQSTTAQLLCGPRDPSSPRP